MEITGYNRNKHAQYTPDERGEIMDEIFNRLMNEATLSLSDILASNKKYPTPANFFKWVHSSPETERIYKSALEVKAHIMFSNLMKVSEGRKEDKDTLTSVSRDRLIADSLKFYISKILPKVYGDKIDVTSGGEAINIINLGGGTAPPPQYIDITPTPTPLDAKTKSGL